MVHLIDKDALVAEIEKRIKTNTLLQQTPEMSDLQEELQNKIDCLNSIKGYILNTLEAKEVDLDFQRFAKEMDAIFALPSSETKNTEENPLNWEYAIAKHFFELGMAVSNKAQKGE